MKPNEMNQTNNNHKEQHSKAKGKSVQWEQQEQDTNMIPKETSGTMLQQRVQADDVTTSQQHHPTRNVHPKELMGKLKKEHLAKEKATTWRVKDMNSSKRDTTQGNREKEKGQTETGKFTNTSCNHSPNSQDDREKGIATMQAETNKAKGQAGEISHTPVNVESQIPLPIKISSNFDVYRPGQQNRTQISPKQNQINAPAISPFTRNTS
ncbi:hypothetical protein RDI58_017676 [Solanum bulbocastanum]|uniref:Uncharacterized protein n=1 Tax=Solanum bulbocastanum TaxID=147425 RepID=A0AAN8TFW4_SOLBU